MLDAVAEEVRRLVDECHSEAASLLSRNRTRLDGIAEALLAHETLDEAAAYAAAGVPHTVGPGTHPAHAA
jgi:cell division protease FtsH